MQVPSCCYQWGTPADLLAVSTNWNAGQIREVLASPRTTGGTRREARHLRAKWRGCSKVSGRIASWTEYCLGAYRSSRVACGEDPGQRA